MRKLLLVMLALMLVAPVAAQEGMPDGDGMTQDDEDSFDYMPFVVFLLIAAVALAIAKYGP